MKRAGILVAALAFSVSVFAQSEPKSEHGARVSATAKSAGEPGSKGSTVSTTASAKSQGSLEYKKERKALKAERKAERHERLLKVKGETAGVLDGGKEEFFHLKDDLKVRAKAHRTEKKESLAAARADLKAQKEVRKAARKESVGVPGKAKIKASTGADVQLRRPKIKGQINAGAGLGL